MPNGPFTDDMIKHYLVSVQTQRGIIEYAEGMAQVLAEAGRASCKVTGDAPSYAVERWAEIIRKRALEILKAEEPTLNQIREKMKAKLKVIEDGRNANKN